jgi:pyridoxine kinase
MATFVMQSLGCDVSAINTVNYSKHTLAGTYYSKQLWLKVSGNHTAYKQVKGTKTSAEDILNLYEGLRQSNLTNFDVLLTGYVPSAEAVQAIGKIGRDVKFNAGTKPGSFFWGACGDCLISGRTDLE